MVSRFVAGDNLEQAMKVAEELADQGLFVSLDLLGENVATEQEAAKSTQDYIQIVEQIGKSRHKQAINISIKLTALGLDQGDDVAEKNLRTLLAAAQPLNIFVRVDMEASPYTERTVSMIERVFPQFSNTGTVLQSYLKRTREDIERLKMLGCRIRVVKGAYLEPDSVAFQEKSKVDAEYIDDSKSLLVVCPYLAIATHDENIIRELKSFIQAENIDKDKFEWQMLYGIRRDLQSSLHAEGFNVRVYVPYGSQWYPYFSRRLAERPANLFFIAKSLFRR